MPSVTPPVPVDRCSPRSWSASTPTRVTGRIIWLSCSFRGSFPVRKGGAVTAEAEHG